MVVVILYVSGTLNEILAHYLTLFTIDFHHGGSFSDYPCRTYSNGKLDFVDLLDSKQFSMRNLDAIKQKFGYEDWEETYYHYLEPGGDLDSGIHGLANEKDISIFLSYITLQNRFLDVYLEHGCTNVTYLPKSTSNLLIGWQEPFDPFFNEENLEVEVDVDEVDGVDSDGIDSDYIVDEDNMMDNDEVDMRDYKFNIDFDDFVQQQDSDLDVLDNEDFDSGCESDENLGSIRKRNLKNLITANGNDNNFFLGQMFGTKQEVKNFVKLHTVESRRELKIIKDDKERVRVVCFGDLEGLEVKDGEVSTKKNGDNVKTTESGTNDKHKGGRGKKKNPRQNLCPWVLLVSKDKITETWMVKTFVGDHKCLQTRNPRACTSTFLSQQLMEQIEDNPGIPVKAVQEQFQRKFEVRVSKMKAFRARSKALKQLHGDYVAQYAFLRDYLDELCFKNPGTTVKLDVEQVLDPKATSRKFKRVYICLGPLKEGYRAIGRDLLGLDGAFLKGPFPGQVLSAVGIDCNNGIYPLAYAIVEAENVNSWMWFLECLKDDLNLVDNSNYTFVSDRQKGILQAISRLFPSAEHRFCLRHILENMKITFKGKAYKDILWKLATSTTVREFEHLMKELKEMNADAHMWLSKIEPKHWSRSHFSGRSKSDVLLNNMCEVFNSKILEARDKPIITSLEYIREYLMRRIVNVLGVIDKTDGPLTPNATKQFEIIKKQATKFTVSWNGGDQYEVTGPFGEQFVVDVTQRKCSCGRWELIGIPCKHAVASIWNMAGNSQQVGVVESWVSPVHKLETWKQVYSFKIFPINGKQLWKKSQVPTTLTPPNHHTPVGRPKKKRKKSAVELEDMKKGGRLSKRNISVTCGKCNNKGHNSRTCKGQQEE